jgi:hypothetical protein
MTKTSILYHGSNLADNTVTLSVNGIRYEYWFANRSYPSVVEYFAHYISVGKALAFAKKHASKVMKEPA